MRLFDVRDVLEVLVSVHILFGTLPRKGRVKVTDLRVQVPFFIVRNVYSIANQASMIKHASHSLYSAISGFIFESEGVNRL